MTAAEVDDLLNNQRGCWDYLLETAATFATSPRRPQTVISTLNSHWKFSVTESLNTSALIPSLSKDSMALRSAEELVNTPRSSARAFVSAFAS